MNEKSLKEELSEYFPECPECGGYNVFDLETKYECEDCGHKWNKD